MISERCIVWGSMISDWPYVYVLSSDWRPGLGGQVDLLTENRGRLRLWANAKAAEPGLLQPFQKLAAYIAVRGESAYLNQIEPGPGPSPDLRQGRAWVTAYYLNELLLNLIPQDEPCPALFQTYQTSLEMLAKMPSPEPVLRHFELELLSELGLLTALDQDCYSGQPIQAQLNYDFAHESGFYHQPEGKIPGWALLNMHDRNFNEPATLGYAKRWLRQCLDFYLGGKPLRSRQVMAQLLKTGT